VSTYVVRQTGRRRYEVAYKGTISPPVMNLDGPPVDRPKPLPLLPMEWEIGIARTERGVQRLIARDQRDRERRAYWAGQTREIPADPMTPAPPPDST